ncbi:MAG TPA: helix-turn-helix transcriptional regulator [Bacteroidia bacterium]|nr:helix-turn-helix transcriptional regulator [Bacteroidia bacterium]
MNKATKARKYSSSKLKGLLDEVTSLEMEKTKTKMQLAARIEDCMRNRSWNKTQFAEHIRKNPSEITKWLSGTQNFTIDILLEIAHTLGVELVSLLGEQQTQVIYRREIVVKSIEVPASIQLKTPLEKGVDLFGSNFYTSQKSQSYQLLNQA